MCVKTRSNEGNERSRISCSLFGLDRFFQGQYLCLNACSSSKAIGELHAQDESMGD